jgi:hypothetical protein
MLNVEESLNRLVDSIFSKGKSFYGSPLSPSLKKLVRVEASLWSGKVIVPRWFPVTQFGRGPRKTTKTTFDARGLSLFGQAIYAWMQKRNMFRSQTEQGKINEAKGLAWYINKHGNKHYRNGTYIDIYDTLIKELVVDLRKEFSREAVSITSDLVKL